MTALVSLWLAVGALGLAIVAVTLALQPDPIEDLDKLHRMIDLVRTQVEDAEGSGRRTDGLRRELRMLVSQLPKDDLRRRRRLG